MRSFQFKVGIKSLHFCSTWWHFWT